MKGLPLRLLKNSKYKFFSLNYPGTFLINSADNEGNLNLCALWKMCNFFEGKKRSDLVD
jgi:hypothetical protein